MSGVCLAILCEIKYVVDYQVKREKRNYFLKPSKLEWHFFGSQDLCAEEKNSKRFDQLSMIQQSKAPCFLTLNKIKHHILVKIHPCFFKVQTPLQELSLWW